MVSLWRLWAVLFSLLLMSHTALAETPTFAKLMDPAVFPKPQRGMVVESVQQREGTVIVRTTGARIELDCAEGKIRFDQRISHERTVAILRIGRPLGIPTVTHNVPGFTRITFEEPAMTLRINGDSLFMLQVHEPLTIGVDRKIAAAWHSSHLTNHLIADEWGAFGLYCSEETLDDGFDAYAETVARYPLPKDAVLCVGVCPPKPYDWERSLSDNVLWHWSNVEGYPSDKELRSWEGLSNIVLLQSEVMLWKDWNLAFVPRLGDEEFARARKTIHDIDMRLIVYTSPFLFLRGTPYEHLAFNSWEDLNILAIPSCPGRGENIETFLSEVRRVMRDYKPDGLYFDGQYFLNPAALYALARRSREIVGEDGILEWHSSAALGYAQCYFPQADAYIDFILRGEALGGVDFDYLRYFVSGYNINNCNGVLCNNITMPLTPELVNNVLRANARLHTSVHTLKNEVRDPALATILRQEYKAKLTPELRLRVDAGVDARQAKAEEKAARKQQADEALRKPPRWEKPCLSLQFDEMPDAEQVVSPSNTDPFAVADGNLQIRAHGHTYAFLRTPLQTMAQGFVVKIRHGTDEGMSWGPAAILIWESGTVLRIGTRSDGHFQCNVMVRELLKPGCKLDQWVWLRARWNDRTAVIEQSADGVKFEKLWSFAHCGTFSGPTAALLVGKTCGSKTPIDLPGKPGKMGKCSIDFAEVYSK